MIILLIWGKIVWTNLIKTVWLIPSCNKELEKYIGTDLNNFDKQVFTQNQKNDNRLPTFFLENCLKTELVGFELADESSDREFD